jgi:hypothetical protein
MITKTSIAQSLKGMEPKTNVIKKVTWNSNQIVEVIYECYIPLRIRYSSYQLHSFTKTFDADAEQYLRDIMRRKNLLRISAPTNEHGSRESKVCTTMATTGHKIKSKYTIKPNPCRAQNRCHSKPRRINPFKIQLSKTESKLYTNTTTTGDKNNKPYVINTRIQNKVKKSVTDKKQGTLNFFWYNKNDDEEKL